MAVVFELVANFGDESQAAAVAAATVPASLRVGFQAIGLHPPHVHGGELSVFPVAVSWGLPHDRGAPRLALDRDEMTELGHRLYDVLRGMRGYRAAMVGWDPEGFTDLAELRSDWLEDLAAGTPDGLVLSAEVRRDLAPQAPFEPFTEGTEWLPYQGERSGNT